MPTTPAAKKTDSFFFRHDGKKYTLPDPAEALDRIKGRAIRDASLGGMEGQLRLGFLMLEAVEADKAALDALYDKPAAEMIELVEQWMEHSSGGVTLPES
jgi:hypothetical protein